MVVAHAGGDAHVVFALNAAIASPPRVREAKPGPGTGSAPGLTTTPADHVLSPGAYQQGQQEEGRTGEHQDDAYRVQVDTSYGSGQGEREGRPDGDQGETGADGHHVPPSRRLDRSAGVQSAARPATAG